MLILHLFICFEFMMKSRHIYIYIYLSLWYIKKLDKRKTVKKIISLVFRLLVPVNMDENFVSNFDDMKVGFRLSFLQHFTFMETKTNKIFRIHGIKYCVGSYFANHFLKIYTKWKIKQDIKIYRQGKLPWKVHFCFQITEEFECEMW